tara:strand:- start:296 stop:1819 length:1524 start_codon:yes stop_codon:yes gene_type:complete
MTGIVDQLGARSGVVGVTVGTPIIPPPSLGTNFTATASGSITNGNKLILNANGTVSKVGGSTSASASRINSSYFNNVEGYDRVVPITALTGFILYTNGSADLYIFHYTLNSALDSVSYGSALKINTGEGTTDFSVAYDASISRGVIVYSSGGPASERYVHAVVVTLSSTTWSKGSFFNIKNDAGYLRVSISGNGSNKFLVSYGHSYTTSAAMLSRYITIIGGSVNEVSAGTEFTLINTSSVVDSQPESIHVTGEVWLAMCGTTTGSALTLKTITSSTLSGTVNSSLSISSANNFVQRKTFLTKISSTKFIASFMDDTNSSRPTIRMITISGTSISAGTAFVAGTQGTVKKICTTYSAGARTAYVYFVVGSYAYMAACLADTDNNTFSLTSTTTVTPTSSSNQNGFSAEIPGDSLYRVLTLERGYPNIYSPSFTNLQATNYVGIADADYADSETATVQGKGVVDDAQTSLTTLTQYFIQGDGTLATTEATPSVVAGRAISSTKLRIDL